MDRLFLFGNVRRKRVVIHRRIGELVAARRMEITTDPGLAILCSILLFIAFYFSVLTPDVAIVIANVHWHANC